MFIVLSGLTLVSDVHAFTPVSGTLASDVTWTKANSPYNLTGTVRVASGVTLTIEPGVTVNLGNYFFDVNGTLIAKGDSNDKIVFANNRQFGGTEIIFSQFSTSWNEQTGQGCIIENAVFKSTILFIQGSPKIANCEIDNAILISGGSPIITNSKIILNGTGIDVFSGSPTLSNNVISGNNFGMGIYGSGSVVISKNTISNFECAIKAYAGSFQITENTITQCKNGIAVSIETTATIQRNLLNNNTENGIMGGRANIDSNTITNNRIGINNPIAGTIIRNNNILGNTVNSITATVDDVDARNNYWGTTDIAAINSTIYDKKVDSTLGTVLFVPILNTSNPSAPAIPAIINTPIVTPPPKTEPTAPPTAQPTPTYTPMPTRNSDVQRTGRDQASPWYSLNMLVIAVAIPLVIVWVVVILGYGLKAKILKFIA